MDAKETTTALRSLLSARLAECESEGPFRECQACEGKCGCGQVWNVSDDAVFAVAVSRDAGWGDGYGDEMVAGHARQIAASLNGYPAALRALEVAVAALEKTRVRWEHAGEALEAFAGDAAREECDEEIEKIDSALSAAARELGAETDKESGT